MVPGYTVSEVYWVDLVKPVPPKNSFNTQRIRRFRSPKFAESCAVSRCIPPPRQGYHLAHPWCPAAYAPGSERLSPSRVVAHHNAHDGCLVAPSRTSRETSVDGTLPWTAHCESLTSLAPGYCHAASTAVTDRLLLWKKTLSVSLVVDHTR